VSEELTKSDTKLTRKMDDSTAELTREMSKVNKALADVIAREKERERERDREKAASAKR
jgi:uncharacterized membrane-anchored protein YhcB (DUF1043 family)